jgi:glycosyltransferase involved in cell wall biosynthesis
MSNGAGTNSPLITVTICCFNGERYLEKTLRSVLTQDYPNLEVVIVDDGSTDGTAKIIERFAGRNSRIRAFFRSNHGLPASRNYSFAQAMGEWIAMVDQDDLWYPSRLSRQLALAESHPSAGFIFCNANHINESDEVIGEHLSAYTLPESGMRKGDAGNLLLRQGCFSASVTCLIRRETAKAVGTFDETIPYVCDYDYFIRAGFETDFAYTRDSLAAWRKHTQQATSTYSKRDHEIRSVLRRYCSGTKASAWTKAVLAKRIVKSVIGGFVRRLGK